MPETGARRTCTCARCSARPRRLRPLSLSHKSKGVCRQRRSSSMMRGRSVDARCHLGVRAPRGRDRQAVWESTRSTRLNRSRATEREYGSVGVWGRELCTPALCILVLAPNGERTSRALALGAQAKRSRSPRKKGVDLALRAEFVSAVAVCPRTTARLRGCKRRQRSFCWGPKI